MCYCLRNLTAVKVVLRDTDRQRRLFLQSGEIAFRVLGELLMNECDNKVCNESALFV